MAEVSREEFLEHVRRSLGKTGTVRAPNYLPMRLREEDQRQKIITIEARNQARRAELVNTLSQTASRQGWNVHRAATVESAMDYVVGLAREKKAKLAVRSTHQVFRRVPLDIALPREHVRVSVAAVGRGVRREQIRDDMAQADIGITGADYAIAETGTCVLVPRRGVSRLVSLLPPIHVAIVEPSQVYGTLDDIFALRRLAFLRGRGDMGSYMSFITGPSRTGDIEQTIVIGVHGPVEVHMVLLEEYQSRDAGTASTDDSLEQP